MINGGRIARSRWIATLESLVRSGVRDVRTPPLSATRVVYRREPAGRERWQTPAETAALGAGDCEDLSIYLARDLRRRGFAARVVIKRTRSGGLHALVAARIRNKTVLLDPSKARGM